MNRSDYDLIDAQMSELETMMELCQCGEYDVVALLSVAYKLAEIRGCREHQISAESLSLYLSISIPECIRLMERARNYLEFDCVSGMPDRG